jgi:hypothetical protein
LKQLSEQGFSVRYAFAALAHFVFLSLPCKALCLSCRSYLFAKMDLTAQLPLSIESRTAALVASVDAKWDEEHRSTIVDGGCHPAADLESLLASCEQRMKHTASRITGLGDQVASHVQAVGHWLRLLAAERARMEGSILAKRFSELRNATAVRVSHPDVAVPDIMPQESLLPLCQRRLELILAAAADSNPVSAAASASYTYLLAAVEVLTCFEQDIRARVIECVDVEDAARRSFVLDQERALLQTAASNVGHSVQPAVAIIDDAVGSVLRQKIADSAVERHRRVIDIVSSRMAEVTALAQRRVDESRAVFEAAREAISVSLAGPHVADIDGNENIQLDTVSADYLRQLQIAREELSAVFAASDTAQRRELNVTQTMTVFNLDCLSEQAREAGLAMRVASSDAQDVRPRLVTEAVPESAARVAELEAELRHTSSLVNSLFEGEDVRRRQLEVLQNTAGCRAEWGKVLESRVQELHVQIDRDTYGETWMEGALRLRERALDEMRREHERLLGKVKSMLRSAAAKLDTTEQEQLYEARCRRLEEELRHDCDERVRRCQLRAQLQQRRVEDECAARIQSVVDDCEKAKRESREEFEEMYLRRIAELNELYDSRERELQQRADDYESTLDASLRALRSGFNQRYSDLQKDFQTRLDARTALFDREVSSLRDAMMEQERRISAERSVERVTFEQRVQERVEEEAARLSALIRSLQELTLTHLEDERRIMEEGRRVDMQLCLDCAFGGATAALRASAEEAAVRNADMTRKVVDASNAMLSTAVAHFQERQREANVEMESITTDRIQFVRQQHEETLRRTQGFRVEQDAHFWERVERGILAAAADADTRRADTELEIGRRFSGIIQEVQRIFERDCVAAHRGFEQELVGRRADLGRHAQHMHRVTLQLESLLWQEQAARAHMCRMEAATYFSLQCRATDFERIIERGVLDTRDDTDAAEVVTSSRHRSVVEGICRSYQSALVRQHEMALKLSSEHCRAIAAYTSQQETIGEAATQLFAARLDQLAAALRASSAALHDGHQATVLAAITRVGESLALHEETRLAADPASYGRTATTADDVGSQSHILDCFASLRDFVAAALEQLEHRMTAFASERDSAQSAMFRRLASQFQAAAGALGRRLAVAETSALQHRMRLQVAESTVEQQLAALSAVTDQYERGVSCLRRRSLAPTNVTGLMHDQCEIEAEIGERVLFTS